MNIKSLKSEILILHRYVHDILVKYLLSRVQRQLQSVKTSMTLRIRILSIERNLLNLEQLVLPAIALQVLKTQYRHTTIPSHEVQHMLQLLLTQLIHILPKP